MCVIATALLFALDAVPVAAQHRHDTDRPRLIISETAVARAIAEHPPAPPRRQDSLANGAIIGAVIGAAALGISGGVICHLLREPGDPPCWQGILRVSVIGGAMGGAAGAGVDAMLVRQPGIFRSGSR